MNVDAWQVVQEQYGDILDLATNRAIAFDTQCLDDWDTNAEVNLDRILVVNFGLSNENMASSTEEALNLINPYKLWQVASYSNCGGYDNHGVICFDCFVYLHYQNAYNIVVSALDTDSVANTVVLSDPLIS